MKCPKTENLLLKLWSMRTTSSARFVGELLPPINTGLPSLSRALGAGKIPAFTSALALGAIMHDGITLLGNGEPCTMPAGRTPPGQFAARTEADTADALGTL